MSNNQDTRTSVFTNSNEEKRRNDVNSVVGSLRIEGMHLSVDTMDILAQYIDGKIDSDQALDLVITQAKVKK